MTPEGSGWSIANAADAREAAWWELHDALPAFWSVGPPTFSREHQSWTITAIGRHPGRGKMPQTVTGLGDGEVAALRDLEARLNNLPRPDGEAAKRAALALRSRLPFIRARPASAIGEISEPTAREVA